MKDIYKDSYLASAQAIQNTLRGSYALALLVAVTALSSVASSKIAIPLVGLTLPREPALVVAIALFFVLGFSLEFAYKKLVGARNCLDETTLRAVETYPYAVNGGEFSILLSILGLFVIFIFVFEFGSKGKASIYDSLGMSFTMCMGYFYSAAAIVRNKWLKRTHGPHSHI